MKDIFKRYLTALGIVLFTLIVLSFVFKSAKADEKTTAIIGHVITQAIQGNDMTNNRCCFFICFSSFKYK